MESKIIKGQAWLENDKLIQEQILLTQSGYSSVNVVHLIEDIWEDLGKEVEDAEYKTNGRGYFWWEYQMSDTSEEFDITIKIECPKPKEGIFEEPYNPDAWTGEYAKYWVTKLKTAQENYEKMSAVQRKEITFPGSSYYDQSGNLITVDDITVKNSDLGDITNLLSLLE